MEKVFINPVAKEILIKGAAKEGPVDLFSYDGNGSSRALGNLFLVGNIQGGAAETTDDIDVGYVLNLVASLAKREYYASPDMPPKDAFSGALKKINGVVEEFFKKKDTKINIGIFAIAGEQIHISKLGKFKILLARDSKNIDILNNIQLFNKEVTDEREFSNIISGKIIEGDRLLAFYPSRSVTAREKSLKDNLLSSDQEKFSAQLAAIKEAKPDFSCVALHIDIQKGTQEATAPRVQPKELREEEVPEAQDPAAEELAPAAAQLATVEEIRDTRTIEEPGPKSKQVVHVVSHLPAEPAIPKIIPSEFARGKRELAFAKHLRRIKQMNFTPRVKMYAMGGIAVMVLIAVFSLKSFVFVSASAKQLNVAISQAQTNLKLAQTKLDASDFIGARELLMSSLSAITDTESKNGASSKADATKTQIQQKLDSLDNAVVATLGTPIVIPVDSGTVKLIATNGPNFYAYIDQSGSPAVAKISSDGTLGKPASLNITPTAMFASDAYVALVDSPDKKISSLGISKSNLANSSFSSDDLLSFEVYKDNLYGLTANGIIKITDAALGHTTVTQWLVSGASLPAGASAIVVDGNVYVLANDGTLSTYYKGKKTSDVKTAVAPAADSMLLTNTDSPNLYLVNKSANRIYIITKSSGTVSKTLKIPSTQAIISAALASDDSIYVLSDNKIWSVK